MTFAKNGKKEVPLPADQVVTSLLTSLLANLEGEYDRTVEMEVPIQPDDIPLDLGFHRQVYEILLDCAKRDIPPTRANILRGVTVLFHADAETAEKLLDDILKQKTVDGQVTSLASWLMDWIIERKKKIAFAKASQIMDSRVGRHEERTENALNVLAGVLDETDNATKRTEKQMMSLLMDTLRERTLIRRRGGIPGPALKFKGFMGEKGPDGSWKIAPKLPWLRWGETTLLTAREGRGKTTLLSVWAEYNAWELGHDVLYLHLETDQTTMVDRMVVRNTLIPMDYLETRIDPDDHEDAGTKKLLDFQQFLANPKKMSPSTGEIVDSGQITWLECPGWDVYRVRNAISLARREAEQRKRGLVVFIDYYNLIESSMFGTNKPEALGQVALKLRQHILKENKKSKLHCIVAAQESENGGEAYAFGSRQIVQYCQVHISIQREEAEEDWKHPKNNALGQPRHWHRKGDWAGQTTLRIVKANNGGRGDVPVRMENPMYRVVDPNQQ